VYRPRVRDGLRPTLLQIHGGGWVIGRKDQQGLPLMYHLASRGWVCVAANYRLSPRATFPDHLIDVKRALAWIRRAGAEHGADPDVVVVTGGSAGGHLAALMALTAGDPSLQPGFEDVDTSVAACIPFYGIYDFLDRYGARGRESMRPFLERYVMKCSPDHESARWEAASPIARVHAGAPPFFVIHGTHDALAPVEDARHFVRRLRETSAQPVLFAELPGAQHAFETFHSVRTRHTLRAVTHFAEQVVAARQREAESGACSSTTGGAAVLPAGAGSSASDTPTASASAANEREMPRTKWRRSGSSS
jgi:acetyl esterase/lipase